MPRPLSIKEATHEIERLTGASVSQTQVARWVRDGKLKAIRLGGRPQIPRAALMQYLQSVGVELPQDVAV